MKWVQQFQLFLFDFDGLLVDTEPFHFAAFKEVLKRYGCIVTWNLEHYCAFAHKNTTALQELTYQTFPELVDKQPDWQALRRERRELYMDIIRREKLNLMPGVASLLETLKSKEIKRCVVTNSTADEVAIIKGKLPLLQSIPLWVTREQYRNPKPDPESYLKAIELLKREDDRAIGFEDSLKGFRALQGTLAVPVLISQSKPPSQILHFDSFESIPEACHF
jgi:beta-phosphoglucomutase